MLYTQVLQTDGAAHRNILIGRQLAIPMMVTIPGGPAVLLPNREPRGTTMFAQTGIATMLSQLGLPETSPVSVLAVEVLPGRPHVVDTNTAVRAESAIINDPLGSQLGQRRILRTSPLTAAPSIC
jgi:hypothetical protein